jgi:hypothetical protein
MVKIIRDFVLAGTDHDIFEILKAKLPDYLNQDGDEYTIMEEIEEKGRLYRKARLVRMSNLDVIPSLIKERLPEEFIETATRLIEENIFYEKEKKIQYNLRCDYEDVYNLSGNVRFIPLAEGTCKVMVTVYMELQNLEKYIPNTTARDLLLPILESRIPDLYIEKQKSVYTMICSQEQK